MLISVIIPAYNAALTLQRCLSSVFNQTYQNIEIICINDGSTDNTLDVITQLKKQSPFPFVIVTQDRKGATSARNHGLSVSKGEYLQFLDADDELLPNKLAHQVELVGKHPSSIIIGSYYRISNTNSSRVSNPLTNDIWLELIIGLAGCTCSNLYPKSALIKVNGWNEISLSSQETELLFNLLKAQNSVTFDHQPLTNIYEDTIGSISSSNKADNWERAIQLRVKIKQYLVSHQQFTPQRENGWKQIIFDCIRMLYFEDPKKSIDYFNKFVKNHYTPLKSSATSRFYIFLFNLLGFSITQKVFTFVRNKR
ncbi:MAG: glycosyltransferase family 2 protein [Bacteroidota bacterium]